MQLRESQKKEDTFARNVRKVAKCCVVPMICVSAGSQSRLAKAAGAEPCVQGRHEKLHAAFSSKMLKDWRSRSTFGSSDVEKLHAAVARSTFATQNAQNTQAPEHSWKLRCRKIARRCSTKHIFKSKCTKHTTFGPLFEVGMWKNCTPLWREARLQVKMLKWHAAVAPRTFTSQNVKNTCVGTTFGGFGCREGVGQKK